MNWKHILIIIGIIALLFGSVISDDIFGGLLLFIAVLFSLMAHFIPFKQTYAPTPIPQPTPAVPQPPSQLPNSAPHLGEFAAKQKLIAQQMEKLRLEQEQMMQEQSVPTPPKPPKEKIVCKICNTEFNTTGQYNKHIFFKHPKEIRGIDVG